MPKRSRTTSEQLSLPTLPAQHRRARTSAQQETTAQRLATVVKSARDIMRKDKGLSGDLDRLPMLTWIMFLKFLDDLEKIHEETALLADESFVPTLSAPYRWRDWAERPDDLSGPDLISFVNNDTAMRADRTTGPGLFAYLQNLSGTPQRDVIATVFRGVVNRMISGFLLRDVINVINTIHFDSTEELYTLGTLYESMLKEMRDAAGDSGEFYTPRPVVKFMVAATDPRLGDIVFDPACGTGGFLVEAFLYLLKQARTIKERTFLQNESIRGGEAKPLPFLLAQMNLLLHGAEAPRIDPGNSLRFSLTEITDDDRVDVILTNPPFGGEEESGIQANFPAELRTSETALLFLQLIMRKLRRPNKNTRKYPKGGRAAVVVPNGVLFGDGIAARIKHSLLTEFNLHTVVRLPNGTFAPYTNIPTNILFFDRSGTTREIWYYELPIPQGRKNYTKTQPIQFEEFTPVLEWWKDRTEHEFAWRVPVESVLSRDENGKVLSVNLDIRNPNAAQEIEHLPPEQLLADILRKERKVVEILEEIQGILSTGSNGRKGKKR